MKKGKKSNKISNESEMRKQVYRTYGKLEAISYALITLLASNLYLTLHIY